jgi:hypothetical protein
LTCELGHRDGERQRGPLCPFCSIVFLDQVVVVVTSSEAQTQRIFASIGCRSNRGDPPQIQDDTSGKVAFWGAGFGGGGCHIRESTTVYMLIKASTRLGSKSGLHAFVTHDHLLLAATRSSCRNSCLKEGKWIVLGGWLLGEMLHIAGPQVSTIKSGEELRSVTFTIRHL